MLYYISPHAVVYLNSFKLLVMQICTKCRTNSELFTFSVKITLKCVQPLKSVYVSAFVLPGAHCF